MYDLRKKNITDNYRLSKVINIVNKIKIRHIYITLIIFILFNMVFYTVETATIIGNWLNDFFNTIINILKNG